MAAGLFLSAANSSAQQVAEKLNRGVVAVSSSAGVLVSWRCLASDADDLGFNIYRDGVKINDEPVTSKSNFLDASGSAGAVYTVRSVTDGVEDDEASATAWASIYTTLQLDRPEGGSTSTGSYTYTPNDCSVADVDNDGDYELLVKWYPSNAQDNSQSNYKTGNTIFDCYEFDGTRLWRVDLGVNVRAGAHYSPFLLYDFDGDGRAEFIVKTAPGSKDSQGNYVSEAATDDDIRNITTNESDFRNSGGHILYGEEFLTVFDGQTGKAIHTIWYWPNLARNAAAGSSSVKYSWTGDSYGNRGHRYNAAVAYLDGEDKLPSAIMQRGYYTQAYIWAVDFADGKLSTRWLHRSASSSAWDVIDANGKSLYSGSGKSAYGQGVHGISVGDVNLDGYDEVVIGSATIAHDGQLLCSTGLGHGDAIHLSDLVPDRPGLEVMMPHEEKPYGYDVHDATTGERLVYATGSADNGRGLAADLFPDNRGFEFWSSADNISRDCSTGEQVFAKKADTNFRIYWDGSIYDQTFDGRYNSDSDDCEPRILYYDATSKSINTRITFTSYDNPQTCNTTKATPCLQADILGDWREELIMWKRSDPSQLLIFSTPIETKYRIGCLMQDHVYRLGVAWQNSSYNQPPHLGYYLPDVFDTDPAVGISAGVATQSVMLGNAISDVVLTWRNASSLSIEGLPDGLATAVDSVARTLTISGTPSAKGEYVVVATTAGLSDDKAEPASIKITLVVKEPDVLNLIASFHFDGSLYNDVSASDASAADFSPAYTSGVSGQAIDLRSATKSSSRVAQDHYEAMALAKQSFTISFWFAGNMPKSDTGRYLFHKGSTTANSTTGATGCWIGVEFKKGALSFSIDDNVTKSSASLSDATAFFDGNWHQFVGVRNADGKALNLYIDGNLVATATDATGDISQTEEMVIANSTVAYDCPFTGVIDELMIYTGAMEATQVATDYASQKPSAAAPDEVASENAVRSVRNADDDNSDAFNLGGQKANDADRIVIVNGSLEAR